MKTINKTLLMFSGAVALFFSLVLFDENEAILSPFLSKGPPPGTTTNLPVDNMEISQVIRKFNDALSKAYLSLDSSPLHKVAMGNNLRRAYTEELSFLKRDGRVMEMTWTSFVVEEVKRATPFTLVVKTVEDVGVRYLKASDLAEIVLYPEAEYSMEYTLEMGAYGWNIVKVETLKVGRRDV